ncbi:MAG TPA: FAD-dependent oxidoreductase, partial [Abditibacteriaceae bacterium]|nr:FAD-dependent oxidoreductase [Abditibacteriaceae bacterium]
MPFDLSSFDVVVCGGGPSGVMAATASARNGARTLLIERHGFPGGSSTAALVHPWLSFHNKRGEQVLAGLGQELVNRLTRVGGALGHLRDSIGFVHSLTPFDPDLCKQVMLQMLSESGAQVLLHAFVVGVERENEHISSVRIVNKSGEFSVGAKVFIDTTGDADVAWQASAPLQNRVLDGKLQSQPMTMYFRMSGVNWNPIRQYILDNPHEFHDETLFDDLRRGEPLTGVSGYFSKWRTDAEKLGIPRDRLL